ncbi:hypothetical protein I4F81_010771 [Pyropia yezoensis]|uniref:Uncharacterized protein n=1 Tax=Pyropia yezoensis TaxID=2788 RepID=A0ACC3CEN1_PYRYE|nr:hypothetical protein I4F81_010771 [Neopyropia yezoensis]
MGRVWTGGGGRGCWWARTLWARTVCRARRRREGATRERGGEARHRKESGKGSVNGVNTRPLSSHQALFPRWKTRRSSGEVVERGAKVAVQRAATTWEEQGGGAGS